jgi:transcriptional regulator with XRE-family HTH domain
MALGNRIRTYREKRGWTLLELSDASGVDVGTISALEVRDSIRSKYALQIARAFGLTLDELLDERSASATPLVASEPTAVAYWPPKEDPLKIKLLELWAQLDESHKHQWLGDLRRFVHDNRPHLHGTAPAVAGK